MVIVFSNMFLIFVFFPHGDYEELWLLLVSQSNIIQEYVATTVVCVKCGWVCIPQKWSSSGVRGGEGRVGEEGGVGLIDPHM